MDIVKKKGPKPIPLVERFWEKVEKSDGCWIWRGPKMTSGYGYLKDSPPSRKNVSAHRYSYEINNGAINQGMVVCHRCDNRLCVRPDHLFLGTQQDNVDDMVRKGRIACGTRQPAAKLTDQDACDIRSLYAAGGFTLQELADKYGVCMQNVGFIVQRKTWKHVA